LGTSNTSHIQDISQSTENSANLHELDDRSQSLNLLETEASPEDTRTTKLITNLQQDPAETDKLSQDGGRMEFNLTPTTNHQPSTINHQPSTINHQPSTILHLTNVQNLTKETKEMELDYETFVNNLDNKTYGTVNSLKDDSLLTTGPTNKLFQTATK
jgi:hypothetical protein